MPRRLAGNSAALAAAALLGLSPVGGCGGASESTRDPNAITLTRQQLSDLEAAASKVQSLQSEISALRARLAQVEMRTGLRRLDTSELKAPPGSIRIAPAKAQVVASAGARPRKGNLADHLQRYSGYVLSFWATWCKPCIADEELAHLEQLKRELSRQNIELVSVAIDDLGKVRRHKKASRWLYPLWFKKDGHIEWLPRSFVEHVGLGLPLFLVVSPDGQVRYWRNNKLDDAAVQDIVTSTSSFCRQPR